MKTRIILLIVLILTISSCSFFGISKDPDDISDWVTRPDSGTVYSYYENKRYYDEDSYMYFESITLLKDSFYKTFEDTLYVNFDTIPCLSAIAVRTYETYHETTMIDKGAFLYKVSIDTMLDRILYFTATNEEEFYLWDFEIRCPIEAGQIWMQRNNLWCRISEVNTNKEVLAGDFNDVIAIDIISDAKPVGILYFSCELGVPIYQIMDSFETRFADEIELMEIKK